MTNVRRRGGEKAMLLGGERRERLLYILKQRAELLLAVGTCTSRQGRAKRGRWLRLSFWGAHPDVPKRLLGATAADLLFAP